MKTLTRYEALKLAVHTYGSQQAMAENLGVTQPTIWRWLHQSKQLPAEHVLRVESDTEVSRHVLRPDIYPIEHRPVSPRFHAVDGRTNRVSFKGRRISKEARA